ncbi:Transcription factor [Penicillium griseofulvum]|uniref:Transcription factor n=1 Tax=Penicillium patulum TaxID=5078 RepID=A0A135LHA5_PENPA|nr:Transcription factor [Penicillium griseofulvum]KXG48290.1 Transcription factor [Penicillium griseofulvum]
MGGEGVVAVEILTLIATYLQWCDRKHDAYLYIGLALRLAIALGCNLREIDQRCLPSQSAHRLRLWWTVYMLDRRLSSGLGLAAGADERQLRTELPRNAMGFQSPIALAINVRIARVTDDIMSSLYGNKSITQLELVQKIQQILQELHETGRSFPKSLMLDFNRPLQLVTRTGASLYLMLFQSPDPAPSMLLRLCDTCDEAATRSLAILESLRRQQTIPRYGFFDLDATFSAAFVLVMVGFLNKSQSQPPPALEQAFRVLQFLSESGNSAAKRRLQDIAQSYSHVWPDHAFNANVSHSDTAPQNKTQPPTASPGSRQDALLTSSGSPPYMAVASSSQGDHQDEIRLLEPWSNMEAPDAMFDMQGDWDLDLSGEAEGIYSSFHNPTLPLTGVDYIDWLEIEKVFNGP